MGILASPKQFLSRRMNSAFKKVGDKIADASTLSPKQIKQIDEKRRIYLSGKPNMSGEETQGIIQKNMGAIGIEIYQAYLEQLGTIYQPVGAVFENFDEDNRIRFFDITKWVTDSEEKSLDKLINVYHVLSEENCNIALIYHRTKTACTVTMGVVNVNESQSDPAIADEYYARLEGAIKGNFPGVDIKGIDSKGFGIGIPQCLSDIEGKEHNSKSVAIVSNVASEKSKDFISQSMEKLLDGIVPKDESEEYTIVLLAKPIKEQLESKNRLYELYTALAPYENWQTGYTYTESDGISSSANAGVNLGVSAGAHAMVNTARGTSTAHADSTGKSNSIGGNAGVSIGGPKSIMGKIFGIGVNAGGTYQHTKNTSETDTVGQNESSGRGTGYNASANFGVSFYRSSNVTANVGKNETLTQTYVNYGVKHTLEIIESQLKRIEESSALGMWEFASYIISDSPAIANNVAHMYCALTQGEESYISKAAVNFWDGDINANDANNILISVQKLQHPVFSLKTGLSDDWLLYPTLVTPTTPLSGKELAKALNFPRKSVSGLPVLEVVPFGREPHSLNDEKMDLDIGCGYHMRKTIPEQRLSLSKEELTKHTFITGSTGSGKSNTIYRLLEQLGKKNVRFLVVEPAKGEYKDVLGRKEGVIAYGTNPNMTNLELLRINPFRFPKHTHILEHLDRLVEIFNVCWPMYAAMPAILKDAVERAYSACGWDLEQSVNRYDSELFPTFTDVVKQVKWVLEQSDYSDDNKGDYTGALVTRLRSLTNGINGLIFSADDLRDQELFDQNVIIDLSRVGSSETKSLIMGLLVLKLQEYRMEQRSEGANTNDALKHITVLEEAHNLLRKTSVNLSGEGSNMAGKSVEMLANAIAEMRTYGEGFVIADQSPGLLDMSVIRNTNTKIILRLPDFSDRELVGRAAGLNENQITELARLEKGVAAISQSDWLEPVLCKIDKYEGIDKRKGDKEPVLNKPVESHNRKTAVDDEKVKQSLLDCIMNKELCRRGDRVDIEDLKDMVLRSKLDTTVKCDFCEYLLADEDMVEHSLRTLVFDFLGAEDAIRESRKYDTIEKWAESVLAHLSPSVDRYEQEQKELLIAQLIYEQTIRDQSYNDILCRFTELYQAKGRIF